MTEDEAKTKWCPFARAASVLDQAGWPAVNRTEKGPDSASYCIASACMAWRGTIKRRTGIVEGHCGLTNVVALIP